MINILSYHYINFEFRVTFNILINFFLLFQSYFYLKLSHLFLHLQYNLTIYLLLEIKHQISIFEQLIFFRFIFI